MYGYVEMSTGLKKVKDKENMAIDYVIDDKGNPHYVAQVRESTFDFFKQWKWELLIGIGYALLIILNVRFLIYFCKSAFFLDLTLLNQTAYSITFIFSFSIFLWVSSTAHIFYNYHNRKRCTLLLVIFTILIRGMAMLYVILYKLFIPYIAKLELTDLMTVNKIVGLGWLSTILPTTIIMIFYCYVFFKGLYKEENLNPIYEFKINQIIKKSNNPYAYDWNVVKDIKTGKYITVYEHDRHMHGCTVGATGTAKTSSTLLPQVFGDLITKARNEDAMKKEVVKLINKGKAYIEKAFKDEDFLIDYIKPNPGFEDELNTIKKKYKSAGITILAPDPSFPDEVYELSKSKGFKTNRIDPAVNEDGSIKTGSVGFNPLHISENIPEHKKIKTMVQKATLVADVMQIMFEISGSKSDPYFSSINRIATTTVSLALMLVYPRLHKGKQPTLAHVRDIINRFDYLNDYLPELNKVNIEYRGEFQFIVDVIQTEFLGDGREVFEKHSKGLKVQFNNFLMAP